MANLTYFEEVVAKALTRSRPGSSLSTAAMAWAQWETDLIDLADALGNERDNFHRAEFLRIAREDG